MAVATVLAIVVAVGEASSPATVGLRLAAEESLGGDAAFRVVEAPDLAAVDAPALEAAGARAVVVVTWRDPAHLTAELRLHVGGTERWRARTVTFVPEDPLAERGRTLGLAVASMWPEKVAELANDEAPAPRAPGPPAPRVQTTAPAAGLSPRAGRPRPSFALGVAGAGAAGVGGPALGLGAAIEAVLPVGDRVALRMGGSVRTGPVSELPGTDLVTVFAAGVEWWPILTGRAGAGVRADLAAIHHEVTDLTGTTAETRGRLLPGADLLGQARLRLNGHFDLVAGAGLEVAFGATELRTGTTPVVVTTIPALRAVAQLGVRVGF